MREGRATNDRQIISALKATTLFSELAEPAIAELLRGCRRLRYPAGTQVFGPSEAAERFFVVLSGRVNVFQLSPRGDQQMLHTCRAGDVFGEAAVLARGRYPAFAEAVEDAMLLAVGRDTLHKAIAANPELAMGMLAGLSAKLREFNRLIEDLSLKEVPARLAGVLLRLAQAAGSDTFRLTQTKRELAARIGTVAETLSRALAKLKAAGLISVRGRQIAILDRQGLEEAARGE